MANEYRITQAALEVLRSGDPNVRITQVAVETLRSGDPDVRVTQSALEVLRLGDPDVLISQVAIEVLRKQPPKPNFKLTWKARTFYSNYGYGKSEYGNIVTYGDYSAGYLYSFLVKVVLESSGAELRTDEIIIADPDNPDDDAEYTYTVDMNMADNEGLYDFGLRFEVSQKHYHEEEYKVSQPIAISTGKIGRF